MPICIPTFTPNQKYRLAEEFPGETPQDKQQALEAEELLREELWTGLVSGRESGKEYSRILVLTSAPLPCLADIRRRLRWMQMTPTGASQQPVHETRAGELMPDGPPEPMEFDSAPCPSLRSGPQTNS